MTVRSFLSCSHSDPIFSMKSTTGRQKETKFLTFAGMHKTIERNVLVAVDGLFDYDHLSINH